MLEALISKRLNGETSAKKSGDVLVVKLTGSPWGKAERQFHAVVKLDDPELESRLLKIQAGGEPFPAVILPYAKYEQRDIGDEKEKVCVTRSEYRINLHARDNNIPLRREDMIRDEEGRVLGDN